MKKINNLNDLKERKQQIKQQQQLLEYKIKEGWKELKEGLLPANIAKSIFKKITANKAEEDTKRERFIKNVINYGTTLIQKQLFNKVNEKIVRFLKK